MVSQESFKIRCLRLAKNVMPEKCDKINAFSPNVYMEVQRLLYERAKDSFFTKRTLFTTYLKKAEVWTLSNPSLLSCMPGTRNKARYSFYHVAGDYFKEAEINFFKHPYPDVYPSTFLYPPLI